MQAAHVMRLSGNPSFRILFQASCSTIQAFSVFTTTVIGGPSGREGRPMRLVRQSVLRRTAPLDLALQPQTQGSGWELWAPIPVPVDNSVAYACVVIHQRPYTLAHTASDVDRVHPCCCSTLNISLAGECRSSPHTSDKYRTLAAIRLATSYSDMFYLR